jgi:hypothetical protein
MRLWSLHPRHLDARGLVALWREGLLARAVLLGRTRGYRHHPQLERFRARPDPVAAIDAYLSRVLDDARARGYRFDPSRIRYRAGSARFPVTLGQVRLEWRHLAAKLVARTGRRPKGPPETHPSLRVVPGPVEAWERGGRPPSRTGGAR